MTKKWFAVWYIGSILFFWLNAGTLAFLTYRYIWLAVETVPSERAVASIVMFLVSLAFLCLVSSIEPANEGKRTTY